MKGSSLRRSFVIPQVLVDEAVTLAPENLKMNLNRLVTVALQEYIKSRKEKAFEAAMAEMSKDRSLTGELKKIDREFIDTESDGPGM
ncbi:MAG: hypothetical protein AB2L14_10570 [Candidatus Xenobiia bacterium LiM19]